MTQLLPVTLCSAAAAAFIGLWLMMRVGKVRTTEKVSIGDGGNDKVIRRMRAHANFVENTPIVLVLIAVIELSGKGGAWLPYVAGVYMLGRVAHGMGMDDGQFGKGRLIGTLTTMLSLLGLAVVAALIAMRVM
ncbi:MAG: MAPEG family protein [Pontixanthobacter sp.]